MANKKKETSARRKEAQHNRRFQQQSSAQLKEWAAEFRGLLLSGRREYARGRSYDAVEIQTRAIEFGDEFLLGFEDDSLVKVCA